MNKSGTKLSPSQLAVGDEVSMSAEQISTLAGLDADSAPRKLTVMEIKVPATGGLNIRFDVPTDFENRILFFGEDQKDDPAFWVQSR